MEILILLFLLSSNQNGNKQQTLQSFLEFYRQNRELIKMITSEIKPDPAAKTPPPEPESNEKTAPPNRESGSDDLIREFLRKHASI